MRRWIAFLFLACLLFWPRAASAQDTTPNPDDVLIRINGTTTIASGEHYKAVAGINNTTIINGTVEQLFIIDGDAVINSATDIDIVVISGTLTLGPNAQVSDIFLARSTLIQEPGSVVTGTIEHQDNIFLVGWWTSPVFAFIIWTLFTIILLCGAVIFVVLARSHLIEAAETSTSAVGKSLLTSLVLWIALPLLGLIAIFTIVGIPLSLTIYLLVLPTLWFLGYIIVCTRLGLALMGVLKRRFGLTQHLIVAAFLGILLFQLTWLIPFVGGAAIALAGLYGSGVLFYYAIRNRPEGQDGPEGQSIDPELRAYGPDLRL